MNNKPSYTNGTVTLGGTMTFEQMKKLEGILQTASLEAATDGKGGDVESIADIGDALGLDAKPLCVDAVPSETADVVNY